MKVTQTLIEKFQPAITSAYLALTDSTITLQQLIEEVFSTCETEQQVLEYFEKTHRVSQDVLKDVSIRKYISDVPELFAEYMEEKTGIKATKLSLGSGREVWWKCSAKGHVFQKSVVQRFIYPDCPICNSLSEKYPELAQELLEKKSGFKATEITCGSDRDAWWKCTAKGHTFQKTVVNRVNVSKCPGCNFNSLLKKYPELARELLEEKSGFKASDIAWKSNKKAWWKCSAKGHIFEKEVSKRVGYPKCPKCVREMLLENSLLKKYPEFARELLEEKSGFKASEVTYGSGRKAWWKCSIKDHVFEKHIFEYVNYPKCPICNSLAEKYPELSKEFMEEKSGIKAMELSCGSDRNVWWQCLTEGHYFQRRVRNHVKNPLCPICNSLAEKYPELARELLEEKSGFKASEVLCGSNKKAWWKCSAKGHIFQKKVNHRVRSPKCPVCRKEKSRKSSTK